LRRGDRKDLRRSELRPRADRREDAALRTGAQRDPRSWGHAGGEIDHALYNGCGWFPRSGGFLVVAFAARGTRNGKHRGDRNGEAHLCKLAQRA
jgi:hypothetical protein